LVEVGSGTGTVIRFPLIQRNPLREVVILIIVAGSDTDLVAFILFESGDPAGDELLAVHQVVVFVRDIGQTRVRRNVYRRLTAFSSFGGDDDHAVSGARPIDGGGSGILEDVNGGHIHRIDVGKVTVVEHAIHHDKR